LSPAFALYTAGVCASGGVSWRCETFFPRRTSRLAALAPEWKVLADSALLPVYLFLHEALSVSALRPAFPLAGHCWPACGFTIAVTGGLIFGLRVRGHGCDFTRIGGSRWLGGTWRPGYARIKELSRTWMRMRPSRYCHVRVPESSALSRQRTLRWLVFARSALIGRSSTSISSSRPLLASLWGRTAPGPWRRRLGQVSTFVSPVWQAPRAL